MLYALLIIPVVGAIIAWSIRSNQTRPIIMPVVAMLHLSLAIPAALNCVPAKGTDWIGLDPIGGVVLMAISILFAACSFYAVAYLRKDRPERPNRNMCLALLLCLSTMTLASVAQHMGLLWFAVAASTVAMAPLIYFNRNQQSIEAAWKYLLLGSTGIALALLGVYFLAYATVVAETDATLMLPDLISIAHELDEGWLKAAFIFMLVGFGTKLGLAPMHTWKPDAYGETPGMVGAILAGALTNCAMLAIIRVYQVVSASELDQSFYNYPLIAIGIGSMGIAAAFLAHQSDFKRMLAYSSVEHVGILAFALGIGKGALTGMMLHMIGNGLAKGALFLSSGTIHRVYGGKGTLGLHGAMRKLPWSGSIFLAGFLAVSAFPPSLIFFSELGIATGAFTDGHWLLAGIFLLMLVFVFLGMAPTVLGMVLGKPPANMPDTPHVESLLHVAPALILLAIVMILGCWLPGPFYSLIEKAAAMISGGAR